MYGKLKQPDHALYWYQTLVFDGLIPDITTYNIIIGISNFLQIHYLYN